MRLMPGKLVIVSEGPDKGKSFTMAGYPDPAGNIITIGREKATAGRDYSHIELLKYRTVSRKQAELIEKDGTIKIKNKGRVNPTQVNGITLEENQEKELKKGDRITMGELELEYEI
jgi:hypothetical protein